MDIVIRKLGNTAPIADEERTALRRAFSTVRHVAAGEDLLHYGDRPAWAGACLQGLLCRYKALPGGSRQIIGFLMPGDVFDLHSFALGALDHSVGALTRATVATAPHAAVLALATAHPRLDRLLHREAMVETAILGEAVVNCGRRSAYARIAHLFCELYARFEGVGLASEGVCSLPLTQALLSDATGLSVVHVNRVLQQLRFENLVIWKGGRLILPDLERLADAAGFDPAYLHVGEPVDARIDGAIGIRRHVTPMSATSAFGAP